MQRKKRRENTCINISFQSKETDLQTNKIGIVCEVGAQSINFASVS